MHYHSTMFAINTIAVTCNCRDCCTFASITYLGLSALRTLFQPRLGSTYSMQNLTPLLFLTRKIHQPVTPVNNRGNCGQLWQLHRFKRCFFCSYLYSGIVPFVIISKNSSTIIRGSLLSKLSPLYFGIVRRIIESGKLVTFGLQSVYFRTALQRYVGFFE